MIAAIGYAQGLANGPVDPFDGKTFGVRTAGSGDQAEKAGILLEHWQDKLSTVGKVGSDEK